MPKLNAARKDKKIKRVLRRQATSAELKSKRPSFSQAFAKGSVRVLNIFGNSNSKINVSSRPKLKRQSSSFVQKVKLIAVGKQRSNSGRDLVKSSRKFQADLTVEEVMERYKLTKRELLQYITEERKKHHNFGKN